MRARATRTSQISLACLARRGIFVTFGNASGAVPPVRASESEPPRRRARHTHLSNRSGAQVTPLKLIGKSAFMCRPKVRVCVRVAIRAEGAEV